MEEEQAQQQYYQQYNKIYEKLYLRNYVIYAIILIEFVVLFCVFTQVVCIEPKKFHLEVKTMAKMMNGKMSMAEAKKMIALRFPDVVALMNVVHNSGKVSKEDKGMIEQQLITLCANLHGAEEYKLIRGQWRGDDVYSEERAKVSAGPVIQHETIFTIVSAGKPRNWNVYVDLPAC